MRIQRGPDPGPFATHTEYKPHLRPLFRCRCAYCITPDGRLGGEEGMTVDHFMPEPELRLVWSNLYYACFVCNSHYKKDHPKPHEAAAGKRFVDPCAEDPDDHFRMTRDPQSGDYCKVTPLSDAAHYTVFRLKFNHRKFLRDFWRSLDREERTLLQRCNEIDHLLAHCSRLIGNGGVAVDAKEIQTDYEQQRSEIVRKLEEIRSLRPFPIDYGTCEDG